MSVEPGWLMPVLGAVPDLLTQMLTMDQLFGADMSHFDTHPGYESPQTDVRPGKGGSFSKPSTYFSLGALVLAGAALAVSLTHHGPAGARGLQGIQGPPGKTGATGQQAQTARLGICWSTTTSQDSYSSSWYVDSVDVSSPQIVGGVYQCPQGDTFVTVVPQKPSASGN
jgi:hypothetical protein